MSENLAARFSGQIQIEYDEVGTRCLASVYAPNELNGVLPVGAEDEFTLNGMVLQSFPDQVRIGRVIFDQENAG